MKDKNSTMIDSDPMMSKRKSLIEVLFKKSYSAVKYGLMGEGHSKNDVEDAIQTKFLSWLSSPTGTPDVKEVQRMENERTSKSVRAHVRKVLFSARGKKQRREEVEMSR